MSLVENYAAERKARLVRLGVRKNPAQFYMPPSNNVDLPKVVVIVPPVEVAYRSMWFWDLVSYNGEKTKASVKEIQKTVASVYKIPLSNFSAARRAKDVVFPRQLAMYLCRELTDFSYPQIGRHFGGRDHSTIIHACRVITKRMGTDIDFLNLVRSIRSRFE